MREAFDEDIIKENIRFWECRTEEACLFCGIKIRELLGQLSDRY